MKSTKGMNKIVKGMLALALVAFSLTLTTQAYAQDIPEPAPAPAPEESAPAPEPQPAPAPEAPSEGVQQIEAALSELDAEIAELSGVTEVAPENVEVVAVSDLIGDADPNGVSEAVMAKSDQVTALREALGAHAAVATALEAAGASVDQVIAARVEDGSKIVLYYQ
jgi:hypothetical protein